MTITTSSLDVERGEGSNFGDIGDHVGHSVVEAKAHLSELVSRVHAHHGRITVTVHGTEGTPDARGEESSSQSANATRGPYPYQGRGVSTRRR